MRTLLAVFLLGAVATGHPQAAQQSVTITLSALKSQVKSGDPVDVAVAMTNTSHREVDCTYAYQNAVDRNYGYDVTYSDGQPAPKVKKQHPEIGDSGTIDPCILKPGKTSESGGRISVLYDFTRPGSYSIQVWRHVKGTRDSPIVRSNTITVTVVAGNS